MKRREFLKASLATTTLSGLAAEASLGAAEPASKQEYYEWRVYRLNEQIDAGMLHDYLEKAAIPALTRLGAGPIGVFTENEPKDGPAVYTLIPFPTIEACVGSTAKINADPEYLKNGAPYLETEKSKPGFVRIDSWVLLAFSGMPKLNRPSYSIEKKPRLFEVRNYQSYSELKALKKVAMFNAGEIETMKEVGLGPIFFGQALIGRDLPHLTYMLSSEDMDSHKEHWKGFSGHPVWNRLKNDPQYADTVSKIDNRFLSPTPYSQI